MDRKPFLGRDSSIFLCWGRSVFGEGLAEIGEGDHAKTPAPAVFDATSTPCFRWHLAPSIHMSFRVRWWNPRGNLGKCHQGLGLPYSQVSSRRSNNIISPQLRRESFLAKRAHEAIQSSIKSCCNPTLDFLDNLKCSYS